MTKQLQVFTGDALTVLRTLASDSVNCCVTSPPYWGLRDYQTEGQFGMEKNHLEYVSHIVEVCREIRRVLRPDGTMWLNLGDSYAASPGKHKPEDKAGAKQKTNPASAVRMDKNSPGLKPKDLVGIPWRVAFALQEDGWYLRQDIIWSKPSPMPESVRDRCTKSHEYIFLLAKSATYYYDVEAVKEKAVGQTDTAGETRRNRRSVWTVQTKPYKGAHFSTFPPKLVEPCILAGCPAGGVVLDPFSGSGTTGMVALQYGRNAVLIELNPDYIPLIYERCFPFISQDDNI